MRFFAAGAFTAALAAAAQKPLAPEIQPEQQIQLQISMLQLEWIQLQQYILHANLLRGQQCGAAAMANLAGPAQFRPVWTDWRAAQCWPWQPWWPVWFGPALF